ncbi:MAG: putative quinol monooxygenase [Tumebacillaceae bacterium]
MSKFGMYVKFTTQEGKRDELVEMLLTASESLQTHTDCELYVVNASESEANVVWVTEVWSHEEAHKASLTLDETRQLIQRAMPLIAGVEQIKLAPLGGKGIR